MAFLDSRKAKWAVLVLFALMLGLVGFLLSRKTNEVAQREQDVQALENTLKERVSEIIRREKGAERIRREIERLKQEFRGVVVYRYKGSQSPSPAPTTDAIPSRPPLPTTGPAVPTVNPAPSASPIGDPVEAKKRLCGTFDDRLLLSIGIDCSKDTSIGCDLLGLCADPPRPLPTPASV